jgi:hypothetical protein
VSGDCLSDRIRAAEAVGADTFLAIKTLRKWSEKQENLGDRWQVSDLTLLEGALKTYLPKLMQLARSEKNLKGRLKLARFLVLNSANAKACALVRAFAGSECYVAPAKFTRLVERFSVWEPLTERVVAFWAEKFKGGYRLIVKYGPLRRAQCLLVRDVLAVAGIDSEIDFSRKGGGGERGLVKKVCDLITEGYDWWWTPSKIVLGPSNQAISGGCR